MADFMQRIKDWKDYRRRYKNDIMFSKFCMTTFRTRSVFWFLLQSPKKRVTREKQENEELEEILNELRKKIKKKRIRRGLCGMPAETFFD